MLILIITILVIVGIAMFLYYKLNWKCVDGKCEMTFNHKTNNVFGSLGKCKDSCSKESYDWPSVRPKQMRQNDRKLQLPFWRRHL